MANGRTMVRLIGVTTVVAGAVIAFASFFVGNANGQGTVIATILGRSLATSWTMTWGDLTFSVFWLGIAVIAPGGAVLLMLPRLEPHNEARMEKELGREVLREKAAGNGS